METKAAALLDAASALQFDAARELSYSDLQASEQLVARDPQQELGWGDALKSPYCGPRCNSSAVRQAHPQ